MNKLKSLQERLEVLEGDLTLKDQTDQNLANLVEIVAGLAKEIESNSNVITDHLRNVE